MHLLFDLDGTLTDPKQGILGCIAFALARLGVPAPNDADLLRYIGPPLRQSFSGMLGPDKPDMVEKAVTLYRERFAAIGLFENHVYPGIVPLLQYLRTQAASIHVATSKPTIYARRIIDHFGLAEYFDGVYGSELDGARSDKSELIAHILQREHFSARAVTMIGDRSHDMIGALNNAVKPVGVLWGYGSREELARAGAEFICDTPQMLARFYDSGTRCQ